jgi:hypothetical protein
VGQKCPKMPKKNLKMSKTQNVQNSKCPKLKMSKMVIYGEKWCFLVYAILLLNMVCKIMTDIYVVIIHEITILTILNYF